MAEILLINRDTSWWGMTPAMKCTLCNNIIGLWVAESCRSIKINYSMDSRTTTFSCKCGNVYNMIGSPQELFRDKINADYNSW